MRPTVVFSPTVPQRAAGMRTEPPVSLPSAIGTRPAPTATPDPLLDPPGAWGVACHGLCGVPWSWLMPTPPKANCTVCVLPTSTMPAAASRRTAAQSPRRHVAGQEPRARRGGLAGDVVEILDRVGNAVERPQVVAAAQEHLRGARLGQRALAGRWR